jgi:hypothetical protein
MSPAQRKKDILDAEVMVTNYYWLCIKLRSLIHSEIPCLLWNSKVHYRIQNSQAYNSTLRRSLAVYSLPPCLLKIHFNIILPSKFDDKVCEDDCE